MASIVEESKESLADFPAETIQVIESSDNVPGSSVEDPKVINTSPCHLHCW